MKTMLNKTVEILSLVFIYRIMYIYLLTLIKKNHAYLKWADLLSGGDFHRTTLSGKIN